MQSLDKWYSAEDAKVVAIIAVSADVGEIFMQVRVPKIDGGALRFVSWPHGDLSLERLEYQMPVKSFGARFSFCANYALRETAEFFGPGYDQAAPEAVRTSFYIDDYIESFATDVETVMFTRDISALLAPGGF